MIRKTSARTTPSPPLGVSVIETARLLGVSRRKVYDLLADGRLRGVKIDARTIIPMREIDRLLSGDEAA